MITYLLSVFTPDARGWICFGDIYNTVCPGPPRPQASLGGDDILFLTLPPSFVLLDDSIRDLSPHLA